ncbi:MAG: efflux RND transporter periplasmic adaptor subunit [Schwartzia sp.]|nr:efflux RND transporter periplasmic adaptor subunit [Schwartzia sp. (in: firmicutes)]MBQ4151562.1 efflux RND transporter periplasmic adaptor subunit [Schwartzia sp. (in: firmicutes)]
MEINGKVKAGIVALVIAAGAFGGWQYYQSSQKAGKAAQVQTVEVKLHDLKSTVSATGTLRPVNSVEVSSKITARIKTVLVKENDKVKAGQTVATLDGKDYEAKREQAQYKVVNAKAKYDRIAHLYNIGASTQEDYEDAVYQYDTALSNLEVTESDLAETVITSPMDGVVVGEPLTPGTMAVQGNSNPTVIMRIADLSTKQIKAKIDETDIGSVRIGQTATFTVDAYPNKTFNARVSLISQTDVTSSWETSSSSSSSSSVSVIYYYVTLDVDDPDNLLLPGMTAQVEVITSDKPQTLAIPISALKTNTGGSYVLVMQPDGSTKEQYIETGVYSDEYVEVLSGLNEGDVIVNSYKAKKSSSSGNSSGNRSSARRGGPPPF